MPLIASDNVIGVLAVMLAIVAFALWVDTSRLRSHLPGVLAAILAGLILSNTGVMPKESPVFSAVWSYGIPLAIPLLLFEADLRRIFSQARVLLAGFAIATFGTVAGAALAILLLRAFIGTDSIDARIAGIISASWIGGSLNFVATSRALEFTDGSMLATASAVDNLVGTAMQMAHVALPSIAALRLAIPSRIMEGEALEASEAEASITSPKPHFTIQHVAAALAISGLIVFASYLLADLADWLFAGIFGGGASFSFASLSIVFVSLLSIALATAFPTRIGGRPGAFETGTFLMYFFFASMGAASDVSAITQSALPVLAFTSIMAATHLAIIVIGAKVFRIDFAVALITSNAVALGPPTAAAMAAGKDWHSLVVPGVLIGLLGYAVGTFFGIAIGTWL